MVKPQILIATFAVAILPMGCDGSVENSSTGGSDSIGSGPNDHF